jgi:hypothetical protein
MKFKVYGEAPVLLVDVTVCPEDSTSWFGTCPYTNKRLFDMSGIQVREITDKGIVFDGFMANSMNDDQRYNYALAELIFDKEVVRI